MKPIDVLSNAIHNKSVCVLRAKDDKGDRIVEPHIVYEASSGNILVDFWQTDGYSSSGNLPSWKRLVIQDIVSIKTLDDHFQIRIKEGYDPSNRKRYQRIICSVES